MAFGVGCKVTSHPFFLKKSLASGDSCTLPSWPVPMGSVVVQDDVDNLARGHVALDGVQEADDIEKSSFRLM
jgi:hypothetical protein